MRLIQPFYNTHRITRDKFVFWGYNKTMNKFLKKRILIIALAVITFIAFSGTLLAAVLSLGNPNTLFKRTWRAVEYNGKSIEHSVTFEAKEGSDGYASIGLEVCNYMGYEKVKITEDTISPESLMLSTTMLCEESLMDLESTFQRIFSNQKLHYVVENKKLTITIGENDIVFITGN